MMLLLQVKFGLDYVPSARLFWVNARKSPRLNNKPEWILPDGKREPLNRSMWKWGAKAISFEDQQFNAYWRSRSAHQCFAVAVYSNIPMVHANVTMGVVPCSRSTYIQPVCLSGALFYLIQYSLIYTEAKRISTLCFFYFSSVASRAASGRFKVKQAVASGPFLLKSPL